MGDFEAARSCFLTPQCCNVDADSAVSSSIPDVSVLRALLLERYALRSDVVDPCISRLITIKGIPVPAVIKDKFAIPSAHQSHAHDQSQSASHGAIGSFDGLSISQSATYDRRDPSL